MPDFVTVTYQHTGASKKTDGYGMREMQSRVFDQRNAQYLLVKAPPASGKSRALMYVGLDKVENQGLRKLIVAVPERSIGASFRSTDLRSGGFFRDWAVEDRWNLTEGAGAQKTRAFADFMQSDSATLVCTHATLRFAYDQLGAGAFANTLVAIDEFHHASADVNSRLGELVRGLIQDGKSHIVAMTGSYFRGDTTPVLRPEDEERFTRVTYTYYEQLNGYDFLKTLGIGYHFYQGRYLDAIHEVLDPTKKTIIHIPSVNAAESTKEKLIEVDRIADVIGEFVERDATTGFDLIRDKHGVVRKVANLVDDAPHREVVMRSLRNVQDKDDVDIIVALNMAKEGFDWVWCEHVLTVGYRGSLTEVVQIIGRATRDAVGKTHAQFTNLIAEPDASEDTVSGAVNNMLKAIACSLLMEQVLAPNFKFKTRADTDDLDGTRHDTVISYLPGESVIAIRGFAEPSTARVRQIVESDLPELMASIFQDETVLRASMSPDEFPAEIINQVLIPHVIAKKYPDLTEAEVEEVRHSAVADGVFKSPSVTLEERDNVQFIRMAERFININDLNIDLIDSINPFQRAYEILSKTVTADVLRTIHGAISASRIAITEDEAVLLYPRIQEFKRRRGSDPNLESVDPLERRMAQALAWLRDKKQKRIAAAAG